jgi:hypothetical protein
VNTRAHEACAVIDLEQVARTLRLRAAGNERDLLTPDVGGAATAGPTDVRSTEKYRVVPAPGKRIVAVGQCVDHVSRAAAQLCSRQRN